MAEHNISIFTRLRWATSNLLDRVMAVLDFILMAIGFIFVAIRALFIVALAALVVILVIGVVTSENPLQMLGLYALFALFIGMILSPFMGGNRRPRDIFEERSERRYPIYFRDSRNPSNPSQHCNTTESWKR